MRSLLLSLFSLLFAATLAAQERTVRIGVLGIFHTKQFTLAPPPGGSLVLTAAGNTLILESQLHAAPARIRLAQGDLVLEANGQTFHASEIRVAARDAGPAEFLLGVPGKLTRPFRGLLEFRASGAELLAIVTMDLETAVASIVQAESAPGTSPEALRAQAVVSRSYLLAVRGRHSEFDFCDLTHCQFLREPPPAGSPAQLAATATRGLVLAWQGQPIAAMFTRSCPGHTLTPADVGLPGGPYPYSSVECELCRKDPVRWTRQLSLHDAAQLLLDGEAGRLALGRRLGWDAVPGNGYSIRREGDLAILDGIGQGHGIGFCQRGAKFMAESGSGFRAILAHYFPGAVILALPSNSISPPPPVASSTPR